MCDGTFISAEEFDGTSSLLPFPAARFRAAGTEAARGYTWPAVRERLLAVYERILKRPALRLAGAPR